jgi:DNA-binding transcriptional regulator GbsR (MarR family)
MAALTEARQHALNGLSRISEFWGFPRAMGAIYGAIYLSPQPLSLDELVDQVGVTKGAISTNVRLLERLGMVHRKIQMGERKDYYTAETDFWKIIKNILREREKSEFDHALSTVQESLQMIDEGPIDPQEVELARFYQKRLQNMQGFFRTLDHLVAMALALDEFRVGALEKFLGLKKNGES